MPIGHFDSISWTFKALPTLVGNLQHPNRDIHTDQQCPMGIHYYSLGKRQDPIGASH
jgi:hypothetical protein